MTSLSIASEVLQDWDICSRHEWLVTNGIGGYASASIAGANTRRYHGLLVAAAQPPLGRVVVLSKLEEEIRIEDQTYFLSANKYPSVIYPQGYRHLVKAGLDPILTFVYTVHENSVVMQKQIWMPHGQNTVFVRYTLQKAPEPIKFALVPFMDYKDYHSEQHRWDGFTAHLDGSQTGPLTFRAFANALPLRFGVDPEHSFTFETESGWFYNYEHEREEERGLDFTEDLYCPGRFSGVIAPGKSVTFFATTETAEIPDAYTSLYAEIARLQDIESAAGLDAKSGDKNTYRLLVRAADQFVIESSPNVSRATIIAGYHWFTDWGRDTFIALPGLTLATNRPKIAKEILRSFAHAVRNGLIPNRFTDNADGAEFNTVDATLWYVYAAHAYALKTGDWDLLTKDLIGTLDQILEAHREGTLYGIHVDPADGLLFAGEAGVQLTWMDAKVGDWVVTPRTGKPVEIQALYYNVLKIASEIYQKAGRAADSILASEDADKLQKSFLTKFVNSAHATLADVVDFPGLSEPDFSVRPNQLFALSLHHPLIEPNSDLAKSILKQAQELLYTEAGMRTLDPFNPAYIGTYGPGDQHRRDAAYHQGTVWPWLFGPFVEAHLKVFGDPNAARELLEPLLGNIADYGLGSIGEIFDGDFPHAPNGCMAQAWSVAEVLRVLALIDGFSD